MSANAPPRPCVARQQGRLTHRYAGHVALVDDGRDSHFRRVTQQHQHAARRRQIAGLDVPLDYKSVDSGPDDMLFQPGERSEEHTSELQSLMRISYAVFCLKKKK